jgi:hypothetical protein
LVVRGEKLEWVSGLRSKAEAQKRIIKKGIWNEYAEKRGQIA